MCVTVNQNIGLVSCEQTVRRGTTELVTVTDVDRESFQPQSDAGAKPWLTGRVGIAVDRM